MSLDRAETSTHTSLSTPPPSNLQPTWLEVSVGVAAEVLSVHCHRKRTLKREWTLSYRKSRHLGSTPPCQRRHPSRRIAPQTCGNPHLQMNSHSISTAFHGDRRYSQQSCHRCTTCCRHRNESTI